jgi:Adaptin N terminal region
MHENSDFLRLVVNSIRKDLDENNEINNCLALHAIANVGGSEMAEALAEDVHRLLISPCVRVTCIDLFLSQADQDFPKLCEEKGCFNTFTTIPKASRCHTSC